MTDTAHHAQERLTITPRGLPSRRARRPHGRPRPGPHGPRDVHDRLAAATAHEDPTIRYWAAVGLGATHDERFHPLLRRLAADDRATTPTGAHVSTAARKALRPPRRRREEVEAEDL